MNSYRKTSLYFGLFFAGTFIFSIPALIFYAPLFDDPEYIFREGYDTRISMGALFEILTAICNIATAVIIYPLFRKVSASISLGYVASRTVESVMIITGVISLMSIITFRAGLIEGIDSESLHLMSRMFIVFHDWTFLLGPQFCSGFGTGILLGYLMYKSGAVPAKMALIGLIGGPLAFIGGVLVLFGILEMLSPGIFAFTALEIIWELSIAFYALFKGFKPIYASKSQAIKVNS